MIKYNLINSMIGSRYPFFLSNPFIGCSHYLYEIYSPGLSPGAIPYLSMRKLSNYTRPGQAGGGDNSIFVHLLSDDRKKTTPATNELANDCVNLLQDVLRKDFPVIESNGESGFPLIEMENGNGIQKSMVLGLRSELRWSKYRFFPGRFIDVLWTPTQFVMFEICGEGDSIWLEPRGVHNNSDVSLSNPLDVDLSRIGYSKVKFSGKAKISDLNRTIWRMEWDSFNRAEF